MKNGEGLRPLPSPTASARRSGDLWLSFRVKCAMIEAHHLGGIMKVANIERWRAMQGLRSSSAAQRHTPKHRKGTRAANKARAIRDSRER